MLINRLSKKPSREKGRIQRYPHETLTENAGSLIVKAGGEEREFRNKSITIIIRIFDKTLIVSLDACL